MVPRISAAEICQFETTKNTISLEVCLWDAGPDLRVTKFLHNTILWFRFSMFQCFIIEIGEYQLAIRSSKNLSLTTTFVSTILDKEGISSNYIAKHERMSSPGKAFASPQRWRDHTTTSIHCQQRVLKTSNTLRSQFVSEWVDSTLFFSFMATHTHSD